jgi:plastocyanin
MTLVHRSRRALVVLAILALAVLGAAPAMAASSAVSIVDLTFEPASITVAQGDTVTWTVTKSINAPHSVTSGKPGASDAGAAFDSGIEGLKDNGQTFQHTFDAAGTFDYFCSVHGAAMAGVVIVQASGEGAPEPEEHAGISNETKLTAAAILAVSIVLMFGLAVIWRRMNPA